MFYKIDSKTITFESENLNLIQTQNPFTCCDFKNKTEQIEWIESTLKQYFSTTKVKVSFVNIDGEELTSLYSDSPFVLKVESEMQNPFTINAKIFVDGSEFTQDVELIFTDGVATSELTLSKSQKYYLCFDEPIVIEHDGDTITSQILHELHEYLIFIGDNTPV